MRRFLPLILVLALSAPAAAWAARDAAGDGTLVVDNGNGVVTVKARGGIIGRFDQGTVVIDDPVGGDGKVPFVYGAEQIRDLGNHRTQYSGYDIRFRMIGGAYRVRVQAIGIDVSAVGRGTVTLDASDFRDFPGRYSINGGQFQPLPGHVTVYTLGQATPGQIGK